MRNFAWSRLSCCVRNQTSKLSFDNKFTRVVLPAPDGETV